jgi:dipeptidyl aminopeptidase/acylaminoacyl peptidase
MNNHTQKRNRFLLSQYFATLLAGLVLVLFPHMIHSSPCSQTNLNAQANVPDDISHSSQKKPLTPELTLQRYNLSDLQLSPDGNNIAFVLSHPVEGDKYKRNIWILNTAKKELRPFTTSEKSDSRPRWSPDGKTLAFLSSRQEKMQIYLIPFDGGEARALTEGKTDVDSFEWSPDGRHIAFLSPRPDTQEEEKMKKEKNDARVIDQDVRNPRLSIIDIETRKIRKLTEEKWRISNFLWMPDGKQIIISATDHPQPELFTDKIYSLEVQNGEMKKIIQPEGPFGSIKVSPEGTTLSFTGSGADGPTSHDLFLVSLSGGKPRNITASSIDRPIYSYIWQKNGLILALAATGYTRTFYSISQDGKIKKQRKFEVQPGSFAASQKLLAFVGETSVQAPELWISAGEGPVEKVSHFNEIWDDVDLIKPEVFTYKSFDGVDIEAALLKPAASREGARVPLVVLIHGGPTGVWSDRFNSWGQLLADRGFAVFCPNIRGSVGYGYEFMIMNRRDWGGADFKDVIAGVDYLVRQGIADPDRLGIGGWSYGGYMAAWAVTQTDRFKASVSGAPMTDLALEYGAESNSINAYDTWFMGTPYENLDLFIERSPMTYVKNVKTPTLILCGENDSTDPIAQCYQFHRGLKRYGVETDFVVYPREGHGIREEKHRIDVLNRMVDWFEKYVK